MARLENLPRCCGIQELGNIAEDNDPERSLMSFDVGDVGAHIVFSVTSSDTPQHRIGNKLVEYIEKHKLGPVVACERPARNPAHTGTLKAWIWTPNKKTLAAFQAKLRKKNPNKYRQYDYYYGGWGY